MAASTIVKTNADGTISIKDGTGTPVVFTSAFSQGDLTVDGITQAQRVVTPYEARGVFKGARLGARAYPSGSFTAMLTDVSDGTDTTLIDFVLRQNAYSGNISTGATSGDAYLVTITLTIEGTDHGDAADHTIVLDDCVASVDFSEGDPSSLSISFTCYGTIALT